MGVGSCALGSWPGAPCWHSAHHACVWCDSHTLLLRYAVAYVSSHPAPHWRWCAMLVCVSVLLPACAYCHARLAGSSLRTCAAQQPALCAPGCGCFMSYVGVLAYLLCSPGTWLGMGQQHSRHLAYYVTQHGPGTPGRVCCVGGPALGCAGQAGQCSAHAAACSMLVGLLMRELAAPQHCGSGGCVCCAMEVPPTGDNIQAAACGCGMCECGTQHLG